MGRSSYSVYLLQSPTHRLSKGIMGYSGADDAGVVPLTLYLPTLLVCSHMLHTHVEQRYNLKKLAVGEHDVSTRSSSIVYWHSNLVTEEWEEAFAMRIRRADIQLQGPAIAAGSFKTVHKGTLLLQVTGEAAKGVAVAVLKMREGECVMRGAHFLEARPAPAASAVLWTVCRRHGPVSDHRVCGARVAFKRL
jgi:hypothetical protein